jgi:hypothetical protein
MGILDALLFRAADCDNGYYPKVAKVRERLAVNKQRSHRFLTERILAVLISCQHVYAIYIKAQKLCKSHKIVFWEYALKNLESRFPFL